MAQAAHFKHLFKQLNQALKLEGTSIFYETFLMLCVMS